MSGSVNKNGEKCINNVPEYFNCSPKINIAIGSAKKYEPTAHNTPKIALPINNKLNNCFILAFSFFLYSSFNNGKR